MRISDWSSDVCSSDLATAESARREVQALQPYRPDYIKAFADGWRYGQLPEETSMNVETLAALADEAPKHGPRVLTHTVTVERGKLAAVAGIDVIAPSIPEGVLAATATAHNKNADTIHAPPTPTHPH